MKGACLFYRFPGSALFAELSPTQLWAEQKTILLGNIRQFPEVMLNSGYMYVILYDNGADCIVLKFSSSSLL